MVLYLDNDCNDDSDGDGAWGGLWSSCLERCTGVPKVAGSSSSSGSESSLRFGLGIFFHCKR
jgi:hypothetical protein